MFTLDVAMGPLIALMVGELILLILVSAALVVGAVFLIRAVIRRTGRAAEKQNEDGTRNDPGDGKP